MDANKAKINGTNQNPLTEVYKTCYNCLYFHTVQDTENEQQHWHNFCSKWKRILDDSKYYNIDELDSDSYDFDTIIYDDFETGVAECYMFNPRTDGEVYGREWFEKNKAHNDKIFKE